MRALDGSPEGRGGSHEPHELLADALDGHGCSASMACALASSGLARRGRREGSAEQEAVVRGVVGGVHPAKMIAEKPAGGPKSPMTIRGQSFDPGLGELDTCRLGMHAARSNVRRAGNVAHGGTKSTDV